MSSGLIGYTGFVGSNLLRQHPFDELYNSKNIQDIYGKVFDLLVCAGVSAVKWKANQEPEADWAGIQKLLDPLLTVKANTLVLISTVDVYPNPVGVSELTEITSEDYPAYGKQRLRLERLVRQQFPQVHILRLPALYGQGLKKNFIFDLHNNNCLHLTHKDSTFQFYNLNNIWSDMQVVMREHISLMNITTEPIRAQDMAQRSFGLDFQTVTEKPPVLYDVQTVHAETFGKTGPYLYSAEYTLEQVKHFAQTEPHTQV
ncbi:MAG: pyridine nucleotide transhydrogenase [Patescibacteria group bacterium]